MFVRSDTYDPGVDSKYTDKITCLIGRGERIFMGREDGVIECVSATATYQLPIFVREFDALENDTIREQIIAVECLPSGGIEDTLFIGNEKSICAMRLRPDLSTLQICRGDPSEQFRTISERRCHNVHSYVMNALSMSTGESMLLSSDFLRINLWSPTRMDKYFTLVDLKAQSSFSVISYVINTLKFSPFSDEQFVWATSSGELHLHDTSMSPKSQRVATMRVGSTNLPRSVSDFAFVDENLIAARSLNCVFLSDIRNTSSPVLSRELLSEPADLELMSSGEAIYQTFKITTDGVTAYTGSCFGSVFTVNLLTSEAEELLVAPTRKFCIEERIRHIVQNGTGFVCAYDGTLVRYDRV